MQQSTITISSEKIIHLSQSAIVYPGIRCEWVIGGKEVCPVVLACWESLNQHYLRHIHLSKHQKYGMQCQITKCNARHHNSAEALRRHIELSHMSRVTIMCPINGCYPRITYRPATLVKHFLDDHNHLNGQTVRLPSEILHTLWKPFYPSLAIPPPLPAHITPGCAVVSVTPSAIRKRVQDLPLPPSPQTSPFSSPRKQTRRQIHNKDKLEENTNVDDGEPTYVFDTLPGLNSKSASLVTRDTIVWRRPTVFNMDVARPQRMCEPNVGEPPASITYDVFAKRFDELEARNLIET